MNVGLSPAAWPGVVRSVHGAVGRQQRIARARMHDAVFAILAATVSGQPAEEQPVDYLTSARQRVVVAAADLPDVLDAAYDAFEDMLVLLRQHQEDDEAAFPAFVMAAAAAANGRDWIAGADALPCAAPRNQADGLPGGTSTEDVASAVAGLSREVDRKLTSAAASAESPSDRLSCNRAAAEAATIAALLSGASPP